MVYSAEKLPAHDHGERRANLNGNLNCARAGVVSQLRVNEHGDSRSSHRSQMRVRCINGLCIQLPPGCEVGKVFDVCVCLRWRRALFRSVKTYIPLKKSPLLLYFGDGRAGVLSNCFVIFLDLLLHVLRRQEHCHAGLDCFMNRTAMIRMTPFAQAPPQFRMDAIGIRDKTHLKRIRHEFSKDRQCLHEGDELRQAVRTKEIFKPRRRSRCMCCAHAAPFDGCGAPSASNV